MCSEGECTTTITTTTGGSNDQNLKDVNHLSAGDISVCWRRRREVYNTVYCNAGGASVVVLHS